MLRPRPSTFGFALAGALLAGCLPMRVDISERVAGGYLATVQSCTDEAAIRADAEATYFCKARGLEAGETTPRLVTLGGNCSLEVSFWCHLPE